MAVRKILKRNQDFWTHDRSLTALLIYLSVALFLWMPLSGTGWFEWLIHDLLFSLIVISGIFAVITRWRQQLPFIIAGVAMLLIRPLWQIFSDSWLDVLNSVTTIVFFSILGWFVVRLIFRDGHITFYRVQGAVVVYIIMGIIWASMYHLVFYFFPGAIISDAEAFVGSFPQCLYFSFVTITTLGYGDITPVHPFARALVIFEAMFGILYPVVMIARLIALEGTYNIRK